METLFQRSLKEIREKKESLQKKITELEILEKHLTNKLIEKANECISDEIIQEFEELGGKEGKELSNLFNKEDIYSRSGKMYHRGPIYSIYYRPEWSTVFGMYLQKGKLKDAGKLLVSGCGIRETGRLVGLHRDTVMKLSRIVNATLEKKGKDCLRCLCGKDLRDHRGWCRIRVRDSPKRIKFLKERWNREVK